MIIMKLNKEIEYALWIVMLTLSLLFSQLVPITTLHIRYEHYLENMPDISFLAINYTIIHVDINF